MRCCNIASARLVSMLSGLYMSATAIRCCTAQHDTQICCDELLLRALIGACRIAPTLAYRPLKPAPQRRQQECDTLHSVRRRSSSAGCMQHRPSDQQLIDTSQMYCPNLAWRKLQRSFRTLSSVASPHCRRR
jgi:hypothetical protein